jgi:2-polyprenyl-3-methyl-5-hydroxy-6-metoxy-1,4-benzoquinol methylase
MFEPESIVTDRYLFKPSPHSSIQTIANVIPKCCKVLDVACCTGYLARVLKEKECEVVGIELDESAGNIARKFCKDVIIANIEAIDALPYPKEYFDVIVFADILEHLRRPDLSLRKFKPYLKRTGLCMVSLPNIARIEMRLNLLLGKFDYTEIGIMDKTHLRFFTFKTAKQLILSEGYVIEKVEYTGLSSKFRILKFMPNLFAYQFIFIATPM